MILDHTGKDVFSSSGGFGTVEGQISHSALSVMTSLLATGHGAPVMPLALYDIGVSLFGLRIRDRMRIMALDALRYIHQNQATEKPPEMIPFGLWNHRAFENGPWCDPYEAIVPSELRNDIPWDSLADFMNIQIPEGINFDTDARLQAEMARQITLKAGLVCE